MQCNSAGLKVHAVNFLRGSYIVSQLIETLNLRSSPRITYVGWYSKAVNRTTAMTEAVKTYQVEPCYSQKFKEKEVREVIHSVLKDKLTGCVYNADATSALTREIADDIKQELKSKEWPRYKYVVHVVIGEQKGEGLQIACRAFWDSNTDSLAKEVFENKSLFAVATAYGVYYY